jgi:hypothetical protein
MLCNIDSLQLNPSAAAEPNNSPIWISLILLDTEARSALSVSISCLVCLGSTYLPCQGAILRYNTRSNPKKKKKETSHSSPT